jgi:hypothetical protein
MLHIILCKLRELFCSLDHAFENYDEMKPTKCIHSKPYIQKINYAPTCFGAV